MLGGPFAGDDPPAVPQIVGEGALHTIVRRNGLDRGHHVAVLPQTLLGGVAGPERGPAIQNVSPPIRCLNIVRGRDAGADKPLGHDLRRDVVA